MYLSRLSIFFIEYHAIEPFPAFDLVFGRDPDGRGATKPKRLRCFCTIASAPKSLRDSELLSRVSKRNLSHLLKYMRTGSSRISTFGVALPSSSSSSSSTSFLPSRTDQLRRPQ